MPRNEYRHSVLESSPEFTENLDATVEHVLSAEGAHAQRLAAQLIEELCDVALPGEVAREKVREIQSYREQLAESLGRPLDFRVAALDYFIEHDRRLHNPRVIELDRFREYEVRSTVDPLTGVYNRRYLHEVLERETSRARRYGQAYAVLFLDIDDFKRVNDQHGHQLGDEVLVAFSRVLERHLREEDVATRYGGEEFVAVLPGTTGQGALQVADRVLSACRAEVYPGEVEITVSVGVAEFPADGSSVQEILGKADQYLYAAKLAGKNRVIGRLQDQRRFSRYRTTYPIVAEIGGDSVRGAMFDVSREGALLALQQPLPVGGHVTIRLDNHPDDIPQQFSAQVMWSGVYGGLAYTIGIKLRTPQPNLIKLARNGDSDLHVTM